MEQFVSLSILVSLSTLSCQIVPVISQNDQNDIASMMTSMEQTIATLQLQMTASNNELASVKTKQQSTESELASVKTALQSQLLAADTEMTTVKSRLKTTESELVSANSRLKTAESELVTVKSQLQITKSEQKRVLSSLNATQTGLATVQNKLTSAQAEIGVLKQDIAKSPNRNEYTQMKTDLALLRAQYTNLTSHLNAAMIYKIGADVSSNTNNIHILNASCNSLHNFIGIINSSAEKNAADIAGLKTDVTSVKSLNTAVKTVQTRLQTTEAELASANSRLKTAESELLTVKSQLQVTESEQTRVISRLNATQTGLTTVQNQLTSAQAEIGVLKQDLANSPNRNEYTQMKTDLALLRAQYTKLTSRLNATVIDKMGADLSSNTKDIHILNASCNSLHNFIGIINSSAEKNAADIAGLITEVTSVKSLNTDVNAAMNLCQKTQLDVDSLTNTTDRINVIARKNVVNMVYLISEVAALKNLTGSRTHISFEVQQMKDNVSYGENEILKFDTVTLNTGNAYNPQTGNFIVPVDGTYLFWVYMQSTTSGHFYISLQKEGVAKSVGYTGGDHFGTVSFVHIIQLKNGDRVSYNHYSSKITTRIHGNGYSHYGGTLLYV